MALIRCDFFSDVLAVGTSMTVLLPQPTQAQIGVQGVAPHGAPPLLYLLHGLSDDATVWTRYTSIERYAQARGLAVVMPQVQRSFYCDQVHGGRFWTFMTQELPEVVQRFFQVSSRREDTFVAGLSMGGFGAMKWALHEPQRFAAAASLSGALDLAGLQRLDRLRDDVLSVVFGGRDVSGSADDLVAVVDRLDQAGRAALPSLYVGCGTDDPLVVGSRPFLDAVGRAGITVHTDLRPGGHEWALWDAMIQDVLAWLPLAPPGPDAPK
jgi:S-formylglutathione hydrolase FrmB